MDRSLLRTIVASLNSAKTDYEKLKIILANKDVFMLYLDNDDTRIGFTPGVERECKLTEDDCEKDFRPPDFDNWLGNGGLVFTLLDVIGIKAEGV